MKSALWLVAAAVAFAAPQVALAEHMVPEDPALSAAEFLPPPVAVTWEATALSAVPQLTTPIGAPHRGFVRGHCTEFVANQRLIVFGGHARQWPRNAVAVGYTLSDAPVVGSIIVTRESRWGHVAMVRSFTEDAVTIEEQNYRGLGVVSTRTLARSDRRIVTYIL